MIRTVQVSHDYATTPDKVWHLATDFVALAEVNEPLISFTGLPETGRCVTGQHIKVDVSLFGRMPAQPYTMDVIECDDDTMLLRSHEHGAGVKSWKHTLQVTATEAGARLNDSIEIDAGLLTPLFALWAKKLYSNRHRHRLRLLHLTED